MNISDLLMSLVAAILIIVAVFVMAMTIKNNSDRLDLLENPPSNVVEVEIPEKLIERDPKELQDLIPKGINPSN